MADISYFTPEGYQKLKEEIHNLKTVQRTEVANAISEAREKGDLSENAEYDAAKEAQSLLELKIANLEQLLANARVLDNTNVDTSRAFILSFVKVKEKKMGKEFTYQLVSPKEANLSEGKISIESPIGKGLLGKAVGDEVKIDVPRGVMEFVILEISR
jgi:transcription elongation factor GreA